MKLTLPIYYTIVKKTKANKTILVNMTWYRNAHYQISNKVKAHYHELVREQYKGEQFNDKVSVHYKIYAGRKGSDGGNIRSIIEKFVLDGLVNVGAIKNDTIDYVVKDSSEYALDRKNPRAEIYIKDESGIRNFYTRG